MDSGNIVVFTASGQEMELLNKKLPELRPGEILVQNHYTTICGSDLHTFCGLRKEKTPTVLGHEKVGKVVKISDAHSGKDYSGAPLRRGDVVTWSIFSANESSDMAQRGMPQKSENVFKYGHALVTDD
ncbi:MAG TPA: alcohol dehydrogenase, partial [Runella sp.]|nr:alcohol dehydrogenase [Runella sp.]